MSKTLLGKGWAAVALFFHNHFAPGHVVTALDIIGIAAETAATINVGREIAADVKAAGTDPAKIAEALAASIKKHAPELPKDLQGQHLDELVQICAQISGLPLETIEAAIKTQLHIK